MDRNSAIGLTLIAVLLLLYFNYFTPAPTPPAAAPATVSTPDASRADTTAVTPAANPISTPSDSLLARQFGKLAPFASGQVQDVTVQNANLRMVFTNQGVVKEVELKDYKTYYQKPLLLATDANNRFNLAARIDGRDVNLYKLYYAFEQGKKGDTTVIHFTANLGGGAYLRHAYQIPAQGFQIGYRLETANINLEGDRLTYAWYNQIPLQEKDITDSRSKTTVNYYFAKGAFDGISETALGVETDALAEPVKWVSIRQKFFISAIIANKGFMGGEVSTVANEADTSVVKDASVKLFIPREDVESNQAAFTYYFGPNDYAILPDVAESFSRNLYLGWPPVVWVNKYLIIPIFKFLENFIGNYGIIIMILVIIIKLILTPLSYTSILGMAKMKLLKPELDLIKEKYGDNMAQIQQEQLKLYQQAGVNPLSGCIPLLLQMPILLAMFYFFPVSIELRQQPFLWAEDLSTYDSILNLPFAIPFYGSHVSLFVLLMTASTLVYTWQNNQISSVQGPMKQLSYIMPVIFMFVLNSFSAGLSYYYFISNLVTFAQQAIIRRFVDEKKIKAVMDEHKKKLAAGNGTGKKSSFMAKLEGAMKASQEAREKAKKK